MSLQRKPEDNSEICPATKKQRVVRSPACESKEALSPFHATFPSFTSNGTDQSKKAPTTTTIDRTIIPLMATLPQGGGGGLPELLTLAEVCAFLKVKPHYIYSLTSTDRIPYRKFAGTLRFVKAEIVEWVDRGRRGPRMNGPATE